MNNGYIKLHRKILDNPIVMKSSDHLAVWMYLLLNATHKSFDAMIGSKKVTLNSGQLITGRKVMAKVLKINESKIQRILKLFENDKQIEQQTNNVCRIISILKWSDYQQSNIQVNNKRTLNNNVKNVKNNIYTSDFEIFWKLYPRKVGKPKAFSSFKKAVKSNESQLIIDSLKNHLTIWSGQEIEYIPHPTTWLNQERYNDQVSKPDKKLLNVEVVQMKKYICPTCESIKELSNQPSSDDLICGCGEDNYIRDWEYKHLKNSKSNIEPKIDDTKERLFELGANLAKNWSI